MSIYYIYELWNPFSSIPFYVGMAKITTHSPLGCRPKKHLHEAIRYRDTGVFGPRANKHKLHMIIQIISQGGQPAIVIAKEGLMKEEAIGVERDLIKKYGRRDLNLGPLTNLTDGGEGGWNMSQESKDKLRAANLGRSSPIKGKKLGPYSKERAHRAAQALRESSKHRKSWNTGLKLPPLSQQHRDRLSAALKGKPSPMKGRTPYNKGKKTGPMTEEQKLKMKGRAAWNKGKQSPNRGKTYEELYGIEKAAEMKEKRRLAKTRYWETKTSPDD